MSARLRLQASHALLLAAGKAKVGSLARIEASWKFLDRARVSFVIFNHPHKPIAPDKKPLSVWRAVAPGSTSGGDSRAAFGDLVITSADLEALTAGGGQTWDMPPAGSWPR
jgi:hypothetical protein